MKKRYTRRGELSGLPASPRSRIIGQFPIQPCLSLAHARDSIAISAKSKATCDKQSQVAHLRKKRRAWESKESSDRNRFLAFYLLPLQAFTTPGLSGSLLMARPLSDTYQTLIRHFVGHRRAPSFYRIHGLKLDTWHAAMSATLPATGKSQYPAKTGYECYA